MVVLDQVTTGFLK